MFVAPNSVYTLALVEEVKEVEEAEGSKNSEFILSIVLLIVLFMRAVINYMLASYLVWLYGGREGSTLLHLRCKTSPSTRCGGRSSSEPNRSYFRPNEYTRARTHMYLKLDVGPFEFS